MTEFGFACQLALGLVFGRAAAAKSRNPQAFRAALTSYSVLPTVAVWPTALVVTVLETTVAVTHLAGLAVVAGSIVGLGLLVTFGVAMITTLRSGREVDCGCFGGRESDPVSYRTILRVVLLLGAESVVLYALMADDRHIGAFWQDAKAYLRGISTAAILLQVSVWALSWPDLKLLASRFVGRRLAAPPEEAS